MKQFYTPSGKRFFFVLPKSKFLFFLIFCFKLSTISAQLSGTYSIGSSGSDYLTISSAVADLSSVGVSGPVVFSLASGTYNEQVVIGEITGSSATNTITFESASGNADDVLLTYGASSTTDNYIIHFSNASHIIVKSLSFEAIGTSYGKTLHMSGTGYDILIENCKLKSPATTSISGNMAVIWFDPSASSNIRFLNNEIIGGSYGIYYKGGAYNAKSPNTEIIGNSINDFYHYGLELSDLSGVKIQNNKINSLAIGYNGSNIFMQNNDGALTITDNELLSGAGSAGLYIYGYVSPFDTPGLIANNVISNSARNYSFFLYNSSNHQIYHNSVNNQAGGPAFRIYGGGGNEIRNNIFISKDGNAIYVQTSSSISSSNYNDFFTTGPHLGRWGNTDIPDLPTWQTTSGMEANSLSFDPQFVSSTDLHAQAESLQDAGTLFQKLQPILTENYEMTLLV